tara:strand:+ start:64 stop:288 length:225 start_codon:yes stop_codon:yes gene_type:complete
VIELQLGDLVVMLETVEWDTLIAIKGELCIIVAIYDRTHPDDGIFFDYQVVTGDGIYIDVWEGEIKRLSDVEAL